MTKSAENRKFVNVDDLQQNVQSNLEKKTAKEMIRSDEKLGIKSEIPVIIVYRWWKKPK